VVVSGTEADRSRSGELLDALGDQGVNLVGATGLSELRRSAKARGWY
jgi:hypothetical protein